MNKSERTVRRNMEEWMDGEDTRKSIDTERTPHLLHWNLLKEAMGNKRYEEMISCMANREYIKRLKDHKGYSLTRKDVQKKNCMYME